MFYRPILVSEKNFARPLNVKKMKNTVRFHGPCIHQATKQHETGSRVANMSSPKKPMSQQKIIVCSSCTIEYLKADHRFIR